MKVPITLTIENEKKVLFECVKTIHGKTFSDILNEGIDACLSEYAPSKLLEIEITQTRLRLMELEKNQVQIRMIEEQMKMQKKAAKEEDTIETDYLEALRNQRFEEYRDSTIKLWKKGDMNWSRIVDLYRFKNISEAREWFQKKMTEVES
jgi:hypothetical protein